MSRHIKHFLPLFFQGEEWKIKLFSQWETIVGGLSSKMRIEKIDDSLDCKWSDDKDNYPDVVIDSDADKNDLGNLNLTKARAQNLKNFLITNLPKLKNAKFEVIAQGSKGICGTEEQNRKYRQVNLTVRKL